ncbi:MAG: methyltransferase domain-containing protein [Calothrix sp. MO_192.B10]|nr:methyltransferase domain-containing protein [Calothrix sp. MO_192.B10]
MTTLNKWSKYWQGLKTPLHQYDTNEHYQQYAAELKILFGNHMPSTVLEIGCGNGDLYEYLNFDRAKLYKGVDFSHSMLENFREKYPNIDVECCDGSGYFDDQKYNLIFSNGVVQYFDDQMLRQHFANAKKMMNDDSYFVCASIPWKAQKFRYMNGELRVNHDINILNGYINSLKNILKNQMGIWYDLSTIKKIAATYNMSVEFYGSMHYMYRFHAVMKLN